jgi:hypothetical protein
VSQETDDVCDDGHRSVPSSKRRLLSFLLKNLHNEPVNRPADGTASITEATDRPDQIGCVTRPRDVPQITAGYHLILVTQFFTLDVQVVCSGDELRTCSVQVVPPSGWSTQLPTIIQRPANSGQDVHSSATSLRYANLSAGENGVDDQQRAG